LHPSGSRQADTESAAFARGAINADPARIHGHKFLTQLKSQARSFFVVGAIGSKVYTSVQQVVDYDRGHTGAGVGNFNDRPFFAFLLPYI
jgi:hypothetical protein